MSTPEKVQINSVLAKSLRVGCPGDAIYDEFEVTFDPAKSKSVRS
jgi:hypothetical protein